MIDRLRDGLLAADYTLDGVQRRLGQAALAALARNSGVAASLALGDADDPQADAIRLWLLHESLPTDRAARLGALPELQAAGLVSVGPQVKAAVELKPHGSERRQGWICSDLTPLDGPPVRPRPDFVLGASPASTTLAQLIPRAKVGSALDLGTGCGIQSLHLGDHCDTIVATDLNPRALELARITLGLSGVPAELRLGSLYEPVQDASFDLIVTNPPYVLSPPGGELVYREGGFSGDGLMRRVVAGSAGRLAPEGTLVVLGNWAITDEPWQERLSGWVPSGCDALILQRERLDPYEYIEVWLADAGLVGTAEYLPSYRRWLEYFDGLGITGVGLGWIVLRNAGREDPDVRVEDWPHSVAQPVGDALGAHFAAIGATRLSDEALLAATLVRADSLTQEALGEPGAADPQHIVLRQSTGLCRAVAVDTQLAAVVGACDGDLPLGVLVDAVASLSGMDSARLAEDLLPRVRLLIADGMLTA